MPIMMPAWGFAGAPPSQTSTTHVVYAPKTCCNPYPPFDEEAPMDSRLSHMGVDPHQYRNALRETNERNRVYKEKFCYVWYGVCLVSLLVLVVGPILTAVGPQSLKDSAAMLVLAFTHLPFLFCMCFVCGSKVAGTQHRAKMVREVWNPIMQSHGVGVEMWADQKHTGPSIGFGVSGWLPTASPLGQQGQKMQVTVPAGMSGGQSLQVETPSGKMAVAIPNGLQAGQTFQFLLPAGHTHAASGAATAVPVAHAGVSAPPPYSPYAGM